MANNIYNSPDQPGVFDRQIKTAYQSQPVAVANAGRTYWCVANPRLDVTLYVSLNAQRGNGPGSHRVGPGESLDSSTVPELTQAAIFITGSTAGATFTFEEVAAVQSAQS